MFLCTDPKELASYFRPYKHECSTGQGNHGVLTRALLDVLADELDVCRDQYQETEPE